MTRSALIRLFSCSIAGAAAACGGSSDVPRPSGERVLAAAVDQCALAATYTDTDLITSFDSVNGLTQCGKPPDLRCTFYQNEDTAHAPEDEFGQKGSDCIDEINRDGQLVESGVVETLTRQTEMTDRCGAGTSALHFVGTNVSMCYGTNGRHGWGASYEIDFGTQSTKAPIDASQWDGLAFWVKKGAGPSQRALIVLAVDTFAANFQGATEPDPLTGAPVSCVSADPLQDPLPEPDSPKCDPFSAGVTLTDDWTFVPIRFADLRQKGFGVPAPDGLDLTKLLRIQFLVNAGDWDFWLDDVSLFREPRP